MAKEIDISFLVQGHINQTIELFDDYEHINVVEGLEAGTVMTTVQEGGDVLGVVDGNLITIGKVVNVDNNLEYEDYENRD